MTTRTLPPGYRLSGIMDFMRNRRQMKIVAYSALAVTAAMLAGGWILHPMKPALDLFARQWWLWLALAGMLVAYIPLHEVTHGVFMLALSGVKPKYGLRLPYAYAGSDAYFDKISHAVVALAPVVVWGILLQALIAALPEAWFWPLWAVQISNVSGSTGDIYCVIHLARLPRDLMIRDTGTRMTIFQKRKDNGPDLNSTRVL